MNEYTEIMLLRKVEEVLREHIKLQKEQIRLLEESLGKNSFHIVGGRKMDQYSKNQINN